MFNKLATIAPAAIAAKIGLGTSNTTTYSATSATTSSVSSPITTRTSSSSTARSITTRHSPQPKPTVGPSPFPLATAPDIIRAHQKDAYFQSHLANRLSSLHRLLLGSRSAHLWSAESRTFASLLYLSLTTLLGNRTLGEEYCDVVSLHAPTGHLPSLKRRAGYIASAVILPYALNKALPKLRSRARELIVERLAKIAPRTLEARFLRYLGTHLPTLLSAAPAHALTLAFFYFTGTYYELAKRILGLRYVFSHKVASTPERAGYEVLGALLALQMGVTAWLHARQIITGLGGDVYAEAALAADVREAQRRAGDVSVSLGEGSYASPADLTDILLGNAPVGGTTGSSTSALAATQELQAPAPGGTKVDISAVTHTPVLAGPHYDLGEEGVMGFIVGMQQRKCTLCLEGLRDPAATQCGHVFCWTCIADWVKEKPECPLCRREALVQHILPLRTM